MATTYNKNLIKVERRKNGGCEELLNRHGNWVKVALTQVLGCGGWKAFNETLSEFIPVGVWIGGGEARRPNI